MICVFTHCQSVTLLNVAGARRRQTAEEREAERQAASRFMLSLHGGAAAATAGADGAEPDKTNLQTAPDPLCLNNASLHALQNLRPWADDNTSAAQRPHCSDDDEDDDVIDDVISDAADDVADERDHCCDLSPVRLHQPASASRHVQLHQPYLTVTAT